PWDTFILLWSAISLIKLTARSRFPSISTNWFDANAELPRPTIRVIWVTGMCGLFAGAKSTSEPTGIGPLISRPAWYSVLPVVSALGSFEAQLSCDEDRNLS